ncbi:hypothetical protein HON22_03405 [Candidatus Peregrinibacteria bacterium]|jgi:hypothetical protein|nr:hypothetical protein [Candidatus Peregrinibacteria bacterium]
MHDKSMIAALSGNSVFSDEDKKKYYKVSQTMDNELKEIFLAVIHSKTRKELVENKKKLLTYVQKKKQELDEIMNRGLKKIYKEVENVSKESEEERMEALLSS